MRSGISYPSYARDAVWTMASGAASSDYPVANLSLLEEIRRVFTASGTGTRSVKFVLPAAVSIDFFAFIHHNSESTHTFRIRMSAGTDPLTDTVYDSGATSFWPFGTYQVEYPAVRPFRLEDPVTARSGQIDFSSNATAWEIAGIEIGLFWSWTDVAVPRSIGIDARSMVTDVSRGAAHAMRQWSPRTVAGSRDVVDQFELDEKLLDFQIDRGFDEAFIWCWDADDPDTWARQCMLVTNETLPAGQVTGYSAGRLDFSFVEHLR